MHDDRAKDRVRLGASDETSLLMDPAKAQFAPIRPKSARACGCFARCVAVETLTTTGPSCARRDYTIAHAPTRLSVRGSDDDLPQLPEQTLARITRGGLYRQQS